MKRVLIISPYFPPSNAADMQRIRMSLPYFKDFDWEAEVVCVDEKHSEMVKDYLLIESIPKDIKIHQVKAFSKKWTGKLGLGSLALRSLYFYKKYVNQLLKEEHFDLIYFSTTQFPVMILGACWKRKFGIPYVIDMQDPWHSDYYQDKPRNERPAKYWFSYRLNKYLEPLAMKKVQGLISVSEAYIKTLQQRYPQTQHIPTAVITFGAFEKDFEIARSNQLNHPIIFNKNKIAFVYVGVVGHIMKKAVSILFQSLQELKKDKPSLYNLVQFYFIGTSYAPKCTGSATVIPIAKDYGVEECVEEQTDRVTYYQAIQTISMADALIIPGSDDPQYTASKLYPYILAKKPILGILHKESTAVTILKSCNAGTVIALNDPPKNALNILTVFLEKTVKKQYACETNWDAFKEYSAENMARKQCELFDRVVNNYAYDMQLS